MQVRLRQGALVQLQVQQLPLTRGRLKVLRQEMHSGRPLREF